MRASPKIPHHSLLRGWRFLPTFTSYLDVKVPVRTLGTLVLPGLRLVTCSGLLRPGKSDVIIIHLPIRRCEYGID